MSEEKKDRFKFTEDILKWAIKMRNRRNAEGYLQSWGKIASHFDCDPGSLQSSVSQYLTGKRKGKREKERMEIEKEVVASRGRTTGAELAKKRGVSVQAVNQRLRRMGLDAEVRRELRQEVKVP